MWKKYFKKLKFPESYVSVTLGFLIVIIGGLLLYNSFAKRSGPIEAPKEEMKLEESIPQTPVDLPKTHTVVDGDNLWKIAQEYYGSGYNWVSINNANKLSNPDFITAGQNLTIPEAEVIKPESERILATTAPTVSDYTVVAGDNLWKIAVFQYGDGYAWIKIAQDNKLANPNLIHRGNVLKIPR